MKQLFRSSPLTFILFVVLAFFLGRGTVNPVLLDGKGDLDLTTAQSVWSIISEYYLRIDQLDSDAVRFGIAKGLVDALDDPYSAFMDPEETKAFLASLKGELQGIGAELRLSEQGQVMVVGPLPNSPAERAGILPGDFILKVDGKLLGQVDNLMEVVMKIRGKKGTTVDLQILHEGELDPVSISIVRENVHIDAVKWKTVEHHDELLGVLTLSSFTEDSSREFAKALQQLTDENVSGLVIDLRFNGGGFLEASLQILGHFLLPEQEAVHTRNQSGVKARFVPYNTLRFNGKVVVLVNALSASASEIVAGALQDFQVATIVGEKTFGKGTVQEVKSLWDGSSLRITVSEWLTPLKRSIEQVGILPDVEVPLEYSEFRAGNDLQMEKAYELLTQEN
ncbi:MAG: S41 family peptidase [bacterium]|nr:S41 family peptidase [bacterium]